ncbi:hypothetical protein Q7P37_000917 [Cladosporium fusiforme]
MQTILCACKALTRVHLLGTDSPTGGGLELALIGIAAVWRLPKRPYTFESCATVAENAMGRTRIAGDPDMLFPVASEEKTQGMRRVSHHHIRIRSVPANNTSLSAHLLIFQRRGRAHPHAHSVPPIALFAPMGKQTLEVGECGGGVCSLRLHDAGPPGQGREIRGV